MYYLTPLVRVTKARRSLRAPVGYGETETSWVIIGDRAILWARDPINDARLTALAEGRQEKLALATRSALSERIKDREFRGADSFADTIAGLLRTPGANPWAALRPSKRRRRYEILLGPREDRLFWSAPAAPRKNTVVYTDDFSGNGNLDGRTFSGGTAQWDEILGSIWATSGGNLTATNIGVDTQHHAVTTADSDTDDIFAEIALSTWTINGGNRFLEFILSTACNADASDGYIFGTAESNEGHERYLFALDSDDLIDDDTTLTQAATRRVERDGSTITAYVNGSPVLSGTHSGEPTGAGNRRASIYCSSGWVSTNDLAATDFSYGDLHEEAEPVEADVTEASTLGASFAARVASSAALTAGAALGAAWTATADAIAALEAGIEAASSESAQVDALASIVAALEAGETQAGLNILPAALTAGIETGDQYTALADAVAAIQAGLEAGETWAGIAAREAGMLAGAEVGATFAGDLGLTAALTAGTEAAAQFVGAAAAYGLMQAGVTASESFAVQAAALAAVDAGASMSAVFTALGGNVGTLSAGAEAAAQFAGSADADGAIQSGVSAADAYAVGGATSGAVASGTDADAVFAAMSGKSGVLSAGAEAAAALTALTQHVGRLNARADMTAAFAGIATATAIVTAGVILGSTFSAESSADPEPPMRRIVRAVREVRAVRVPGTSRVVRVH